jgi:glycosyltransferase involved in cell wall biosynthesis
MSSECKLAVVIPCFNAEQTLSPCIHSVLSFPGDVKISIIVVDDGSIDDTVKTARSISQSLDSQIHILSKENGGVSSARNYGLNFVYRSNFDYVLFLDADDILLPDTLPFAIGLISNSDQIDFISFVYRRLKIDQLDASLDAVKSMKVRPISVKDYADGRLVQAVSVCSTLFRVKSLRANSFYFCEDFAFGEDQLFMFQALRALNGYLNKTQLYGYIDRMASSAMGQFNFRQFELIDVLDHVLATDKLGFSEKMILEQRKFRVYNNVLKRLAKQSDFSSFKVIYEKSHFSYQPRLNKGFEPLWYKIVKIFGKQSYWIYLFFERTKRRLNFKRRI